MGLILSIVAALFGSVIGAGVRAGVGMAERQLEHAGPPDVVNLNGSLVGGVAAGVVGDMFGGPRLAFWLGAVLGAAGADRLDWWILRRMGVDPEQLVARAREKAMQAGQAAREAASQAREGRRAEESA